jgi:hypothetical protein
MSGRAFIKKLTYLWYDKELPWSVHDFWFSMFVIVAAAQACCYRDRHMLIDAGNLKEEDTAQSAARAV